MSRMLEIKLLLLLLLLIPTKQCKVIIHRRIEDIALQKWNTDVSTTSMCRMYRLFKKQLDFEKLFVTFKLQR